MDQGQLHASGTYPHFPVIDRILLHKTSPPFFFMVSQLHKDCFQAAFLSGKAIYQHITVDQLLQQDRLILGIPGEADTDILSSWNSAHTGWLFKIDNAFSMLL